MKRQCAESFTPAFSNCGKNEWAVAYTCKTKELFMIEAVYLRLASCSNLCLGNTLDTGSMPKMETGNIYTRKISPGWACVNDKQIAWYVTSKTWTSSQQTCREYHSVERDAWRKSENRRTCPTSALELISKGIRGTRAGISSYNAHVGKGRFRTKANYRVELCRALKRT